MQRVVRTLRPAVLGLWIGLLLLGCSTPKVDWGGRVGNYTYDQAVREMGPPDKLAQLSDGAKVAEWLTRRGYAQGTIFPSRSSGPYTYMQPPALDRFIRLSFSPDGRLVDWKEVVK